VTIRERKQEIRAQAHANRNAQADKEAASRAIMEKCVSLPEYAAARTVMCYVAVQSEVRTRDFLLQAMGEGKRVVVPYCAGDVLELFHLEGMDELAPGVFKLLEPKAELRGLPGKRVFAEELDLVMVPGVAFDRRGGRLGHGKGYYDRLLARVRPEALLVGVAFECQMFPEIPMLPYDIYMDLVITEKAVYRGLGRGSSGVSS